MIAYLKAGALKIKGLRGVLEGMVESTQKIKTTKMDFTSPPPPPPPPKKKKKIHKNMDSG